MKAWCRGNGKKIGWYDIPETGYEPDEDGYCNCFTCQYYKRLEENLVPDELFEME